MVGVTSAALIGRQVAQGGAGAQHPENGIDKLPAIHSAWSPRLLLHTGWWVSIGRYFAKLPAFRIGAGVLFVAQGEFAVFLHPARIFVSAGQGFDGLALLAASGLDDGGVNHCRRSFLYF